ncbi:MAG: hypothetical protein H5U26_13120 [Immundisolibacter sp.]|uniref:hypothetical protein n=1 Tax=Immundisolibacter sp. TaxID=1934948 RepID=UPI0019B20B25|nr:hypothetical protein [Immundisolibacter sp.]MBC7163030.1 hypothetical protein [Immundisolibacter sp.]
MIHVLEVPQQGRAQAWFAFDETDLIGKIRAARARPDGQLHAVASPRELLAASGQAPDTAPPWIAALAQLHGWDTPLYRADALLGEGIYQAEPVSELRACVAALVDTLQTCRVYPDDQTALDALYRDPLYQGRDGFYAHMALREQLIALEVLADDL